MKVECVINGQVRMLITPENEMEEKIIGQLMKQVNTFTEVRSSIFILGRQINHGILIETATSAAEKKEYHKPKGETLVLETKKKDDTEETKEM